MNDVHPVRRMWRFMRSALWPIPLLTLALAVLLGVGMPVLDLSLIHI